MIRRSFGLLVRDFLTSIRPLRFPSRDKPLAINFVFHVEHLGERALFESFLRFLKHLRRVTDARPLAAILAWPNPLTQERAAAHGCSQEEFAKRVAAVAQEAEIGMHGHFFGVFERPEDARKESRRLFGQAAEAFDELDRAGLVPVGQGNYDDAIVEEQFAHDLEWLRGRGHDPRVYAGGQWMMHAHLAGLIERQGFAADTTIRSRHAGALGAYLPDGDLPPRGVPFFLPPTRRVVEIQSLFYPTVHPSLHERPLRELLATEPGRELFAVLPAHETEVARFHPEINRHVALLRSLSPAVRWLSVGKMAARAASALAGR